MVISKDGVVEENPTPTRFPEDAAFNKLVLMVHYWNQLQRDVQAGSFTRENQEKQFRMKLKKLGLNDESADIFWHELIVDNVDKEADTTLYEPWDDPAGLSPVSFNAMVAPIRSPILSLSLVTEMRQ